MWTNPDFNIEKFMAAEYSWRHYNCWNFARDVWLDLTGKDIGQMSVIRMREVNAKFRDGTYEIPNNFEQLDKLEDPCLVCLIRPRGLSHAGVFVGGRLLHLPMQGNVSYQELMQVSMYYPEMRFYR